jgi:hypothetical protein
VIVLVEPHRSDVVRHCLADVLIERRKEVASPLDLQGFFLAIFNLRL